MIGILYESDEWSDWKLGRELEAALADNSWRHVRMINMEDAGAVEQARSCAMLVSRVFASAAFRGHQRSHRAMEDIIALAEAEGIPLINPGRAHHFEIDKRLATETLRNAGITAPAIIAWGTPAELGRAAADLDDSRSAALSREEASEAWSPVRQKPKSPPTDGPGRPRTNGPTLASSSRTAAVAPRTPLCCAALPPPAHF